MKYEYDYDDENDILYIYNSIGDVEESVQISEDIVIDLDNKEKIRGIEIFYASEFFGAFNNEINKHFLKNLEEASLEYKEFRNQWFIIVILKSENKKIIQPMPPLRKSEYISPLMIADS
ncbi:MAG: DUF2283 domain-containing protein [Nanoarchaeota archaeon]